MKTNRKEDNIILQLKNGSSSAFRWLVNEYQDYVYSICLSILKNKMEAEEAAQDTFLKCYKSINKFNGKSKFSTWLYQIAYRTSIDFIRKRKHTQDIDDFDYAIAGTTNTVEENLEQKELQQQLANVINQLGSEERILITLFYLQEKSVKEVCAITNLNESNVKVKLYRARKKMYDIMSQTNSENNKF